MAAGFLGSSNWTRSALVGILTLSAGLPTPAQEVITVEAAAVDDRLKLPACAAPLETQAAAPPELCIRRKDKE